MEYTEVYNKLNEGEITYLKRRYGTVNPLQICEMYFINSSALWQHTKKIWQ